MPKYEVEIIRTVEQRCVLEISGKSQDAALNNVANLYINDGKDWVWKDLDFRNVEFNIKKVIR